MSNARITSNTRNLTMRLPLDIVDRALKLAKGRSLTQVIVEALRDRWELPEGARNLAQSCLQQKAPVRGPSPEMTLKEALAEIEREGEGYP
jgi:hypothetical protein